MSRGAGRSPTRLPSVKFFDAADFVAVSQAHIMADTESLGEAGVRFLEGLAAAAEPARRVRVPAITDPRGIEAC